jgi:predicted MPP superfamily phosphohydrolase
MTNVTRRLFLQGAGAFAWAAAGTGTYALAFEPALRLNITSYHLCPPRWPEDLHLRAAVLADIHACEPWMPASRVRGIAELTNDLKPDIVFLLGDFSGGHNYVTGPVYPEEWGEALSILRPPLGAFAVLGNHDWWHGPLPDMPGDDAAGVRKALQSGNITVLENHALRLSQNGRSFWVAGLGDQLAGFAGPAGFATHDDLETTLRHVKDDAPVILLAHEPEIFRRVPDRISLTLCGHTHGGQVGLPIPVPPGLGRWQYLVHRQRELQKAYGLLVEKNRHLIISAGLGTSYVPVRFMRPPEVVLVTLGKERLLSQL